VIKTWFYCLKRAASDLEWSAIEVWSDGTSVPWADLELWVRGFRSELEVSIAQTLADSVDSDVVTGSQETDVLNASSTHRIHLGELCVLVPWEELGWVNDGLTCTAWWETMGIGLEPRDSGVCLVLP